LLLVDVDGVISLYGFDLDTRPAGRFVTVDGIQHYLSATAGEHLRALARHFELVWCTGWEDRADDYLPHALSLPFRLPFLTFDGLPGGQVGTAGEARGHWKLDAIERHAGGQRPVAWIDDDHEGCEEWALARPGPTLLVTTEPAVGITEAHVEELVLWARHLRTTNRAPGA
jgi:hypothetical protein